METGNREAEKMIQKLFYGDFLERYHVYGEGDEGRATSG